MSPFGATITRVRAPDRDGKVADVTLGYDTVAEYDGASTYFGAIVGRVANRIAKGAFKCARGGAGSTLHARAPPPLAAAPRAGGRRGAHPCALSHRRTHLGPRARAAPAGWTARRSRCP